MISIACLTMPRPGDPPGRDRGRAAGLAAGPFLAQSAEDLRMTVGKSS